MTETVQPLTRFALTHFRIVFMTLICVLLLITETFSVKAQNTDSSTVYDLVIAGGRVIDPETNLDGIRNIGIKGGTIAAISRKSLPAIETIDVNGHVVSPGFIDIHTHSPTELGQYYQAMDGTTTALELEAGASPLSEYASAIRGKALINYGASTGYISIRFLEKQSIKVSHIAAEPEPVGIKGYWTALKSLFSEQRQGYEEKASADERAALRKKLESGLRQGGIGVGLALDYISEGVNPDELRMIFEVTAAYDSLVFIHIRRGINGDPAGLYEVLELAKETGASLHICHLQHSAMRNTALFLDEIAEA